MALVFPKFIVINFNYNDKDVDKRHYMGYINENGEKNNGHLAFTETQVVSAYARFEVETADIKGLVHIRSCQNNKYWVRTKENDSKGDLAWITATAKKPENDQSKESCTLFKFIIEEAATNTYRIVHIQSGCYLSSKLRAPNFPSFVGANDKTCEENKNGIFKIIDWDSLVILPKYMAFKGDNDQYLCLRYPLLQFSTDDIGDSTATFENFTTEDGIIRIKSTSNNLFWRRSPNWIVADSNDNSNNNKDTLFRPIIVDYQTIGLRNLGNNNFCKRLTLDGNTNCLNAYVSSITKEAKLKVEEPVVTRKISDVKYDLENSRVYDETVHVMDKNSATNIDHQPKCLDVKLSYTNIITTNWKTMFSLNLGMKTTAAFSIPLIFDGKVEISGEVQSGVEWGETTTTTTVHEVVNKVVVPPMYKVTVSLIATKGKCDVPFTFMQKDTLYDGKTITTEVHGGTYTGSNYYNIRFEIEKEKI